MYKNESKEVATFKCIQVLGKIKKKEGKRF